MGHKLIQKMGMRRYEWYESISDIANKYEIDLSNENLTCPLRSGISQ